MFGVMVDTTQNLNLASVHTVTASTASGSSGTRPVHIRMCSQWTRMVPVGLALQCECSSGRVGQGAMHLSFWVCVSVPPIFRHDRPRPNLARIIRNDMGIIRTQNHFPRGNFRGSKILVRNGSSWNNYLGNAIIPSDCDCTANIPAEAGQSDGGQGAERSRVTS